MTQNNLQFLNVNTMVKTNISTKSEPILTIFERFKEL